MPLSGPHVICSTSWAWGISQTSPGHHQSPADTLTWPRGRPGNSLCHGGRRPRPPTCSLSTKSLPRPRLPNSARPGARLHQRPAPSGGASRPTPYSPRCCPSSWGPEGPEEAGGTADSAAPGCKPREPASTCKSGEPPPTSTTAPNPTSQPSEDLNSPSPGTRPRLRRLLGPLARECLVVPPSFQLSFSPRPQSDCAASSGGREPWTWRGRASLGAGPGALCLAARWASPPHPPSSPRRAPRPSSLSSLGRVRRTEMESSLEASFSSSGAVSGASVFLPPARSRIFKIIVIGDSNVGKTCLTYRFCAGRFPDRTEATIGVDFRERAVEIDGERIKILIW
uniref:ras-related protein Rab-33B isoform X2 n=1 Tax=Halichoerus grypus TaxID=9711 RepID=UPI001659806A|nr:ras-related protein Rab-33B isoform X2 [Halichoerus grypus]